MNPWLLTASLSFVLVSLGHSWLVERLVLKPLLRQPWEIGMPRAFAEPLLRLICHLPSAAWLVAALILGWAGRSGAAPLPALVIDALGSLALVSGAGMMFCVRGTHPAWVVFALATLACLVAAHGWPSAPVTRVTIGASAALVLAGLGVLHVYWAAGGRWGARAAVPTRGDGTALFRPSPLATVAVAVALFGTAAIIASAAGLILRLPYVQVLGLAVAAAFALRMIGDFRVVGLFKRERRTPFARWDSMLFSPLCGALCAACVVAAA